MLKFLDDSGYSLGMIRDGLPLDIPPGGVYDALNMLSDQPGILRQRNASTALVSGSQTAALTSLGFCYSQDGTPIEELYGLNGKTADIVRVNNSTGAFTTIANTTFTGVAGRPVRHFGFLILPVGNATRVAACVAGQISSTTFLNTANATIAAGNQQITLSGADVTTNIKVGATVFGAAGGVTYLGRVVSIDTTKLFTVWPTPTVNLTVAGSVLSIQPYQASSGGKCVTSFQNRLLHGNVTDWSSVGSTLIADRRVYYSVLPTESSVGSGGATYTGATFSFMGNTQTPVLNYFEVPGADPIVAMEPISDGELVILTASSVIILQGNLVTQNSTTSPSITFDIYPLGVTEGCASDLSVQRTPVGIMWAGAEGVFAYWPPLRRSPAKTGIRNLCEGKILNYWLNLSAASDFAVHGAAYARNHYIVSGFANGATFSLAVNLGNDQWTRLSGAGTDIFNGVRRPTNPAQTFVARWWDQTGAAPSMTNGQVLRDETMFNLYTAGSTKLDADGSAVALGVTTKPIGGDLETQKMFQRGTARYQAEMDTAAITVTAQSKADPSDINTGSVRALGSLSSTATRTITAATNASPIAITTSAVHGLQTDDPVNIDAVGGNTNANGRWRVTVTGTTTFTLNGTSGNAAYTSGGQVQRITEADFALSGLNMGQAASFTFANSGTVKNFELHGVRIGVLERMPVMST